MNFLSSTSQDSKETNSGFTLMELVISIGIFAVVVMAAAGIMISVFAAQAKAVAVKDVLDNARFALELITREIRTGSDIQYPSTPSGCPHLGIQFTSYNQGSAQERFYYWEDTDSDGNPDAVMRVAMPSAGTIDCGLTQQLTSQEVIVRSFILRKEGLNLGPEDGQPRITIGFTILSRDARYGEETDVSIQTTVVPRLRDSL